MPTAVKALTREDVTDLIMATKIQKRIKWADVAPKLKLSKEWVTAACLGQMALTNAQAKTIAKIFDLPAEAVPVLEAVPYKGSLRTSVPTDPLIYRFYELISVYGTTFKELIHEEFGDGIMSAIDFKMDLQRQPDPNGDRVQIVMSGKYLSYKTY
ncbi:MAG: cyanase [Pseudomonadota bacterium]|jgi:cyanate lyase